MRAALFLRRESGSRRVVVWLRMIRNLLIAVLVILTAGMAGFLAYGQTGEALPGTKVRKLPRVQEETLDPRLDQAGKLPRRVAVHPANTMKQEDKDLAAGTVATIQQRAAFFDLGFSEGDWQQSQLDCPALAQHLFLRFTRDRGAGDVSMFVASIPRGKDGRVRVIPILRRGYALISPAPTNRLTIAAFNQIRAEERMGEKADWPALSLCYAALSSARWAEPHEDVVLTPLGSETLELTENGGVSVALELDTPAPGRWVVIYDRKGQLSGTEYTPFGNETWRPLPPTITEIHGRLLPPTTDVKGQPLPSGPTPAGKPLPTGPGPTGQPIPPTSPADSQTKPQ